MKNKHSCSKCKLSIIAFSLVLLVVSLNVGFAAAAKKTKAPEAAAPVFKMEFENGSKDYARQAKFPFGAANNNIVITSKDSGLMGMAPISVTAKQNGQEVWSAQIDEDSCDYCEDEQQNVCLVEGPELAGGKNIFTEITAINADGAQVAAYTFGKAPSIAGKLAGGKRVFKDSPVKGKGSARKTNYDLDKLLKELDDADLDEIETQPPVVTDASGQCIAGKCRNIRFTGLVITVAGRAPGEAEEASNMINMVGWLQYMPGTRLVFARKAISAFPGAMQSFFNSVLATERAIQGIEVYAVIEWEKCETKGLIFTSNEWVAKKKLVKLPPPSGGAHWSARTDAVQGGTGGQPWSPDFMSNSANSAAITSYIAELLQPLLTSSSCPE